ncbi:hypothetical protein BDW42DRAFT_201006 [Aspergillus taichungensis]|uniref:F-box domain-containing protein n=1 Tax=Aspergillus taichungensis TaxID=482145 RepID=A0A2J5HUX0_9EURO|nr:hypothetical protein BDW42DRAFT_201006 [Aspergillus taichungensis]
MARWLRKILRLIKLFQRRNGYERLSPCEEPPWSLLLELPLDILLLIIPYLRLVDKACLALTCKPLYRLLCSVHGDEQLAWPRYLASPLPACEFGSEPHVSRNDLLLKLQDTHWIFCRGCLKLHPKNHFRYIHKRRPNKCEYSINLVNVVDLCACLALTYANGIKLVDWIQTGVASHHLHQNTYREFQFRELKNTRFLIHRCSVTSQPDAFVALTATVALDADNRLVVTTRYNVYWSTPHPYLRDHPRDRDIYQVPHNIESIFVCPHIHALAWLYGRHSRFLVHEDRCGSCATTINLIHSTGDGLHSVIQAERNLGFMYDHPSKLWVQSDCLRRWWNTSRRPGNPMEEWWYR